MKKEKHNTRTADGLPAEFDWNFDDVPDDELMACCYWEYARESKLIAMKADLHWCHLRHVWFSRDYQRDPSLMSEHDKEALRIEERAKREGFDYDNFCERYWKTDYPLLTIYDAVTRMVGNGARAWQRLPKKVRATLSNQVSDSPVLRPLAAATVNELEELWKGNSAHLMEVRSRVRPKNDDSEDAALWAETSQSKHPRVKAFRRKNSSQSP